ncbi:hypothetical protein [Pseudomonas sp. 58(2021)]|uniref:hypothetical protein n=1 Tax=Pseudomonas sp. 58(2021) TaxID=2813330 RepID=UPI001A9D9F8B|nr:hypothetical protein [Pseudomonas sp. 58(2021)]
MSKEHSKKELEIMLRSNDSDVVIDALLYLCFNINDPEWIQAKCIEAIEGAGNDDIKGLAITCIGHVARIHSDIDRSLVVPILRSRLTDDTLSGRAQDALDDIDMYVK